jgi:hypothetical protein
MLHEIGESDDADHPPSRIDDRQRLDPVPVQELPDVFQRGVEQRGFRISESFNARPKSNIGLQTAYNLEPFGIQL